jgi:hypothetical protein
MCLITYETKGSPGLSQNTNDSSPFSPNSLSPPPPIIHVLLVLLFSLYPLSFSFPMFLSSLRRHHSSQEIRLKINFLQHIDGAVGIAAGYGLDDRVVGVRVPVVSRIFSSPRRPDRPWGPPSLLSNGYRGLFPRG